MTDHTSEPTRKPRVALMGEFSAGKSTLSNLLLDGTPFPVRVTATRLPPVWTSYGESGAVAVGYDDEETPIAPEEIADVSLDETRLIRLQKKADILELCDLVDMPGISDPNMPAHVWMSVLEQVDCVIWCTHATQAWRQSEAAIWERAMAATNGNNILLVTQIDKLRNDRDRGRVVQRVRRETEGLFQQVFAVSILQAMKAEDEDALRQSGVAAFLEHLVEMLLRPVDPAQKGAVDWDMVPELPKAEAAADKRIAPVTRQPVVEDTPDPVDVTVEEETTPTSVAVEATSGGAIMPKRVRRPGQAQARPRPTEATHVPL